MREPKRGGGSRFPEENDLGISCSAKALFRDKAINPVSDLGFKMGDFTAFTNLDLSPAAREVKSSLDNIISVFALFNCHMVLDSSSFLPSCGIFLSIKHLPYC